MGLRAEAELLHTTSALRSTLSSAPSFHTGTAAIVKYQQYLSLHPIQTAAPLGGPSRSPALYPFHDKGYTLLR